MRYFYTEPLEAAYMAKHFEMRFVSGFHKKADGTFWEYNDEQEVIESCLDYTDAYDSKHSECYCVHPDSLKILEPQVGDLLKSGSGAERIDKIYDDPRGICSQWNVFNPPYEIIQRSGKHFFMPENKA